MPEPNKSVLSSDLRDELLQDLSIKFSAALDANASLPVAAREALVRLLKAETHSAADIIAAASKCDSTEKESADE